MNTKRIVSADWSLAVHGGAGSSPATWSAEKRESRKLAMEVALDIGRRVLSGGGTALDAVESAVAALESDGNFHAGRGATLTTAGHVELDASIMDGATAGCGGVAAITVVTNPIHVARRVMHSTPHVLIVGSGADAFARQQAFPMATAADFLSLAKPSEQPSATELKFGTVGCVARDSSGNLAAATSTSGTTGKLAGRVGDSPLIGAGTFADNRYGAVSATGIGEEFIRRCVAYDLIAQVRYANRTLGDAAKEMFDNRLPSEAGGIIGVDASGEIVIVRNTPGMSWGAADAGGRFETGFE